jgi:hypothetical protein
VVLHGLEHRDDASELHANFRVVSSLFGAGAGDADCLGGQDRAGEIDQHATCTGEHDRRCAVERHATRASRRIKVRGRVDRDAALRNVDHQHVVADTDEQHIGKRTAEHAADAARCSAIGHRDVAAERDRADRGSGHEAR